MRQQAANQASELPELLPPQDLPPLDGALALAERITLADLLECDATVSTTIRSICILRLELMNAPPERMTAEVSDLEIQVNRLYHLIGEERRNLAHRERDSRRSMTDQRPESPGLIRYESRSAVFNPTLQIQKGTSTPCVNPEPYGVKGLCAITRSIMRKWQDSCQKFTFTRSDLVAAIKELHAGNALYPDFHPHDLVKYSSGGVRWEVTLSSALTRLRAEGDLSYSQRLGLYTIMVGKPALQ